MWPLEKKKAADIRKKSRQRLLLVHVVPFGNWTTVKKQPLPLSSPVILLSRSLYFVHSSFFLILFTWGRVFSALQKMQFKTLTSHSIPLFQNPTFFFNKLPQPPPRFPIPLFPSNLSLVSTPKKRFRNRIVTASCISNNREPIDNDNSGPREIENGGDIASVSEIKVSEMGNQSIWQKMKEIVMFTGPATGLWICGPLMSLIDTAVIGQGSSIELAALGIPLFYSIIFFFFFFFISWGSKARFT